MKLIIYAIINFVLLSLSGINLFSFLKTKTPKDLIFTIISISGLISFYFYLIIV